MNWQLDNALRRAAGVVIENRDILEHRVDSPQPPAWLTERGWESFFASLSGEQLEAAERGDLPRIVLESPQAPKTLGEYVREIQKAVEVPRSSFEKVPLLPSQVQAVSQRKRLQISSILGAAGPLADGVDRVVDVAAGRGHLTRLSSTVWNRRSVGIEREESFIDAARSLALDHDVSFRRLDAFREPLELHSDDLVMGLHACGEVGDVLLAQAAEVHAPVFLVSCCLQKVRGEYREPLSESGRRLGLRIARPVLGLANLTPRPVGVEAPMTATMQARTKRHALRILLERRGIEVPVGREMRGINRRRALGSLEDIAARALRLRGQPEASSTEIQESFRLAQEQFPLIRRWSLARGLLARPLEVVIILDRAMFLQERGYDVQVAEIFGQEVSPRNLAIFSRNEDH